MKEIKYLKPLTALREAKPIHYRSWIITRTFPSGYYSAWKSGELRLRADTLAGLKQLIHETSKVKARSSAQV
jgi:hypothetical protein